MGGSGGCPRICVCIGVGIGVGSGSGSGGGSPVGVVVEIDSGVGDKPAAAVADNEPYLQEGKVHFIVIGLEATECNSIYI